MTSRQLTLIALACFVLAIPLSHSAISAKKKAAKKKAAPAKVALCHFSGDNPVGHVIEVSSNAVAAHVEKHGDCTEFASRPNGACRCLTCEESCEAAGQRCATACEGDQACIAQCREEFNQCIASCDPPPDPS